MVATALQRPSIRLVLFIFIYSVCLISDVVHCWSFFGRDNEDNTAANDNDDDNDAAPSTNQRRSLSSFDNNDKYTHTIPANKPITS